MPVKTGIHLRFRFAKENLDSVLRRNDGIGARNDNSDNSKARLVLTA